MTQNRDNRAKILDSAERLFAENGFSATSVRQILKEADVSSPMLYYYFGSKRDLLSVLLKERFGSFKDQTREEIELARSAQEVFKVFLSSTFEAVKENPTSFQFMYSMMNNPANAVAGEECKDMSTAHLQFLWGAIKRLRPEVSDSRLLYAVMIFQGAMMTFIFQFLMGLVDDLPDELAHTIAIRSAAILDDTMPVPALTAPWQMMSRRNEP